MIRFRGAREAPLFELDGHSQVEARSAGRTIVGGLSAGGGDVRLFRGWLPADRAGELLAHIHEVAVWAQERRKMYDRFVDVPREQAWFGDDRERAFTPPLDRVRRELEALEAVRFSYVLLNRYRDGNDSVAWHNDREVEHMRRPVIASLTLGATRAFDLRPKADRAHVISIDLDHGDLVIMRGETQQTHEHRVRKDPRVSGERINLTFRQLAE